MVKSGKKILAAIIAVIMALSVFQVLSFAGGDDPEAIYVEFSYYDKEFVIAPESLYVVPGLAKEYGFETAETDFSGNPVTGITVFDVIVAAHLAEYGDAFTAETASDYISLSGGYITKIFGEAVSFSFSVNGATPNDGVYNEQFGSYTGYNADAATVEDGDVVQIYVSQDSYWADYNTYFDSDKYTAVQGEEITATITGVCLVYYGCNTQETIDSKTIPMYGATLSITEDFENYTELGTTDENGSITFTVENPGEYYLVTSGAVEDDYSEDVPVIGNYAPISVLPPETEASVEFSFYDNGFSIAPVTLNVSSRTAEQYGFETTIKDHNGEIVDGVTVFDVLVAAHINEYGDAFTEETAEDYIGCAYGFVSKIFGEAKSCSFSVNGQTPNDGVINESFGTYTGYTMDTAQVEDGDVVQLYVCRDAYWSDYNTYFDSDEYTAVQGEEVTATITGVCLVYYGCSTQETIDSKTIPMNGAALSITEDFENYTELGTTDENGSITFTVENPGEYYLVTGGAVEDDYSEDVPVIGNYAKITVTASEPVNPTANAAIKVKSETVYKNSDVTIVAKGENIPDGFILAVYDGEKQVAKGDKTSVTYKAGEISADKTLVVKVVDENGNVQKGADGNDLAANVEIKVKTGFFNIIIAFFRKLFRMNAVTIEA